jgi:cytochrome c oxidase cbb3-type subunit I/II
MPSYPWLYNNKLNISTTKSKIHAMRQLGVPYPKGYEAIANDDLKEQAEQITANLTKDKRKATSDKEIIALIAYLQRLGRDIKAENAVGKQ